LQAALREQSGGLDLTQQGHAIELGDLQKQGWDYSLKDFEMTDEELLGE